MKQIKSLILLAVMFMVMSNATAYDFSAVNEGNVIYYEKLTASTVAVTYGSSYGTYYGVVTIPETVTNEGKIYHVTEIGRAAFFNCSEMTGIVLPSTITAIGMTAFGSSGIQSIELPSSLTELSGNVFHSCYSLSSITIPENVAKIGSYAFYHCTSLEEVEIPDNVVSISTSAFEGCLSLKKATIGKSVKTVGTNVFSSCYSFETLIFNEGIEVIPRMYVPDASEVTIPSSATAIADYAFTSCESLEHVDLSGDIITIGKGAFFGTGLKELVFGASIQSIGDDAFFGCSNITKVSIPLSVEHIGSSAFSLIAKLDSVLVENEQPLTLSGDVFYSSNTSTAKLIVPHNTRDAYRAATGWNVFTHIEEVPIIEVDTIILNQIAATVHIGDTLHLFVDQYLPETAEIKDVVWTCDAEEVATLGADSVVTALSPGVATFTATAKDGSGHKTVCVVTVSDYNLLVKKTADGDADKFWIESGAALTINDTVYSLTSIKEVDDVDVTYQRTIPADRWVPWYMPIEFELTQDILNNFAFAKAAGTNSKNNEFYLSWYTLDNIGENIYANTPYLVKARTSEQTQIDIVGATLKKTEETSLHMMSAEKHVYINGSYTKKVSTAEDDYYTFGGGTFNPTVEGKKLNAFRIYVVITDRDDNPYKSADPVEIKTQIIGDVDATSIDLVEAAETPSVVYDLAGRIVKNPSNGVFIVNGKKVFIK